MSYYRKIKCRRVLLKMAGEVRRSKIRDIMQKDIPKSFEGIVEVDETYQQEFSDYLKRQLSSRGTNKEIKNK